MPVKVKAKWQMWQQKLWIKVGCRFELRYKERMNKLLTFWYCDSFSDCQLQSFSKEKLILGIVLPGHVNHRNQEMILAGQIIWLLHQYQLFGIEIWHLFNLVLCNSADFHEPPPKPVHAN